MPKITVTFVKSLGSIMLFLSLLNIHAETRHKYVNLFQNENFIHHFIGYPFSHSYTDTLWHADNSFRDFKSF